MEGRGGRGGGKGGGRGSGRGGKGGKGKGGKGGKGKEGGKGDGPSPALLTSYIKNAQTPDALFETFTKHGSLFNHIHLSACWSALGQLSKAAGGQAHALEGHAEPLQALVRRTTEAITAAISSPELRARQLANIAHGAAKAGAANSKLMAALARAAEQRAADFNCQELANVVWAFAKAQHAAPSLFDALAEQAKPWLAEFKPQELSNTAWAYATARHGAPALFDAMAREIGPRLSEFNEQALSNTLWAFATAKRSAPALFDAAIEQVVARPSELTPQALSTIAWAFASTRRCTAQLMEAIAGEAQSRLSEFNAQQLSSLVWAFAKADYTGPELFVALASSVGQRLSDFNPQDLANTAYGLAKACHVDEALFAAMARSAIQCVDSFNLQDLVNTAWAFAKVGRHDVALFAALARSLAERPLADLDAQHMANVAWAFSKAASPPDAELFASLARAAQGRAGDLAAADVAAVAWAFANAGQLDPELFAALAKRAERLLDQFTEEERDNVEWAFTRAGQQRIVRVLRQRKGTTAGASEPAPAPTAAAVAELGRVVVVGCGIGGAAAAVALQRKGFDVVVLESDASFDSRKQGYGLTIQGQGATLAIGVSLAKDDAPSTSHYTFNAEGQILGFFGEAFGAAGKERDEAENSGRFVHIPRQVLRQRIVEQIAPGTVKWGSKLKSFSCWGDSGEGGGGVTVTLMDGTSIDAALLVGSDGIFSTVRNQLELPGDRLNYVGLVVVLGILPTVSGGDGHGGANGGDAGGKAGKKRKARDALEPLAAPLAQRRIFETVDGTTRIYAMPFTTTSTMWQLSFPYPEKEARALVKDPASLKAEILRRCGSWHAPVPALLEGTPLGNMSGYPVYDRQLLEPRMLREPPAKIGQDAARPSPVRRVTLMGDAAHPMTPFKAQGANQALSDAVLLAESLAEGVARHGPSLGVDAALPSFEEKMLSRSARVVVGSREKAKEMHSGLALQPARKVQRETATGVDMQKAIGVLRAKGVGAHNAADARGLDAVVLAAIGRRGGADAPVEVAEDRAEVVAEGGAAPSKRRRSEAEGRPVSAAADLFKWWRAMRGHLDAAGEEGMRRKQLREAVIRQFLDHLRESGEDTARWEADPAELQALFRAHLQQARAAGRLSTSGKLVCLA